MANKDLKAGSKEFTYTFELSPKTFGFIHASAPVYGLVGQNTNFGVTLVGWERDAKKLPGIDVTMNILDDAGKPTLTKPLAINVPKDIPEEEVKKRSPADPPAGLLQPAGPFHRGNQRRRPGEQEIRQAKVLHERPGAQPCGEVAVE